jgi:hypothetical protein
VHRTLLAVPLVVVMAAGCGSGGEKRLSRDEYAKRADGVCRAYNTATRRLGRPTSMRALARVAGRSLPFLDRAVRDLRRLRPPKEEEAMTRTWLRQLTLLRRDVVRIRDRARANDANGVRAVVPAATKQNERFATLAAQLGMTVCSRP